MCRLLCFSKGGREYMDVIACPVSKCKNGMFDPLLCKPMIAHEGFDHWLMREAIRWSLEWLSVHIVIGCSVLKQVGLACRDDLRDFSEAWEELERERSVANHFLRNTNAPYHDNACTSLFKDARTIQHVLYSSVIPKAGDQIHITPLLSLTTFYIMAHRDFNATDLLFRYIKHLNTIRDPGHRRHPNLALGHIIAYALEIKYDLQYPVPPNIPPSYFTNNSFHVFHSTRLYSEPAPDVEEEEEETVPVPVAPDAPAPLRIASPFNHLVQRFDQWEARFDSYVAAQEQQHTEDLQRFNDYVAQQ
ncbi:hypothetical protein IEQ34_003206 [Dendrobium chrysotoxum]|uniref:Uncharacterized protein n=1 Tax=Dendrobium chrysotoxum TaxID=161865 RepID=A0AAV7HKM8_DENCH|nr:hypothetical protein IEQ34_003206 [Dendrobium chrysotoxum]